MMKTQMLSNCRTRPQGKNANKALVSHWLLLIVFLSCIQSVHAKPAPDSRPLGLRMYDRLKLGMKAPDLASEPKCEQAFRVAFNAGTMDHMITIRKLRVEGTPETFHYTIETLVQILTESGSAPVVKNEHELPRDQWVEISNYATSMELFELPSAMKETEPGRGVLAYAEKWSAKSKSKKVIARDITESRVLDEIIKRMYLLALKNI